MHQLMHTALFNPFSFVLKIARLRTPQQFCSIAITNHLQRRLRDRQIQQAFYTTKWAKMCYVQTRDKYAKTLNRQWTRPSARVTRRLSERGTWSLISSAIINSQRQDGRVYGAICTASLSRQTDTRIYKTSIANNDVRKRTQTQRSFILSEQVRREG